MARDRRRYDHAYAGGSRSLIRRLVRSWRHRVAVAGHSMEPTLREGDWLLVDPDARPALNDVVAALDPDDLTRLIIKRVVEIDGSGRLILASDNPDHVGQRIGPLDPGAVRGRVWLRYWPAGGFGRIV